MGGGFRYVTLFLGILSVTIAQDISITSPLFFPNGEMPDIHPHALRPTTKDASSTKDSEWRLPKSVSPQKYHLELEIDPEKETFSGSVKIVFRCESRGARQVILHGANLDIQKYSKFTEYYREEVGTDSTLEKDLKHQRLTFTLNTELTPGLMYTLNIEYQGRFTDGLFGLYRSNYTQNGELKWLAVTHFEPFKARLMFPCFDEPDMKAFFYVQVTHPQKFTAISNAPLQGTKSLDSTKTVSTFEPTVRMPTYLLAVLVSEYKNYSNGNERANVWAREDIISGAKFTQELAADALRRLEEYTQIRFPMKKIDHVAVPHFGAGAMENYGMITYREGYLSLEDKITTTTTKVYTVTVTCHELVHQWFGDLVTLKWWSYTWLNEAFATYFAYFLPGEDLKWRLREQFIPAKYQVGMEADEHPLTSVAMSSDVETPDEIASKFDAISYSKGASVVRMFNELLGKDVFQEALQQYLINRAEYNAKPAHLFSEIAKVASKSQNQLPVGLSWPSLGKSWTGQAGLPLVKVERNYVNGDVTLTQKRFCIQECKDGKNTTWWIPITWRVAGEGVEPDETYKPQLWLYPQGEHTSITFKPGAHSQQWLLINPKSIGYYRVSYDDHNWKLLGADLLHNPKNFPTENRAQILHDALQLALGGEHAMSIALNISLFLQNEDDFVVWMTGVKVLRNIYTYAGPTGSSDAFEQYARKLVAKSYGEVGLEAPAGKAEEVADTLLRAYVAPYACMFGEATCLKDAQRLLEGILDGSSVHPDVETAAACGGVRVGGKDIFWKVRQKALEGTDPQIKSVLLSALACAEDGQLITEHLVRAISEENFPKNKIIPVISSVIKSYTKFNVGFEFIRANIAKISALVGKQAATNLIFEMCGEIRTIDQRALVSEWAKDLENIVTDFDRLKRVLGYSLTEVNKNAKLQTQVSIWLSEHTGIPITTTPRPTEATTSTAEPSTENAAGSSVGNAQDTRV